MSRYYRFKVPTSEDYSTDEDYQEALSAWENAEDDYAEEYMERRRYVE